MEYYAGPISHKNVRVSLLPALFFHCQKPRSHHIMRQITRETQIGVMTKQLERSLSLNDGFSGHKTSFGLTRALIDLVVWDGLHRQIPG